MAIIWPDTVPNSPLKDSYSEAIPDGRLRTSVSSGPDKVRRKSAALPVSFTVDLHLSSVELDYFESFVEETLAGGSLRFEFTHPRKGTIVEMRFVGGDALYSLSEAGIDVWKVSFQLEALP